MQKRAAALTALLLCLLAVSVAYAAYSVTVSYTKFNSTMRSDHATGYTGKSWTVTITNNLVFNATQNATKYASIYISNSSSTSYYAVNLNLALDVNGYSLDVLVPTKVDPSGGDWVRVKLINNLPLGKPVKVTLSVDGKLSVIKGTNALVDKYDLGETFVAAYIGCRGSGTFVATGGTVDISVGGYTETPTQTALAWMPIVITFAMLAMVLGMIRKYT